METDLSVNENVFQGRDNLQTAVTAESISVD